MKNARKAARSAQLTPAEIEAQLRARYAKIANKLSAQSIISPEEQNDANILAGAAVLECQLLVSAKSASNCLNP